MVKISKYHILILYIAFSVGFFFLLGLAMRNTFVANTDDFFSELGQIIDLIPAFLGAYTVSLTALSVIGAALSKRKNRPEIYKGFVYSIIYSIILLLISLFLILQWYIAK
jgi:hypothetical protein